MVWLKLAISKMERASGETNNLATLVGFGPNLATNREAIMLEGLIGSDFLSILFKKRVNWLLFFSQAPKTLLEAPCVVTHAPCDVTLPQNPNTRTCQSKNVQLFESKQHDFLNHLMLRFAL